MKILNRDFDTPEEHLSCDEALLELCEEGGSGEVLRFWQPRSHFIVLGYSNEWKKEVTANGGARAHYPVFRRSSGGGTVLQGPGCLNYSLILKIPDCVGATHGSPLHGIVSTNKFIMEKNRAAVELLVEKPVRLQGSTDLTLGDLKFSGNSQRRKRRALLFHGTFLLDFDLSAIERGLAEPPKQPAYRRGRPHREFLVNLGLPAQKIMDELCRAWHASGAAEVPAPALMARIAAEKFGNDEWNYKR